MQGRQRNYWAFLANPKVYNIEKAIREQEEDSWTVPRSDVRTGDRAIIWKAKGNDLHRGIVALVEILTDPIPAKARNGEYWVDQQKANKQIDRVQVRYLVPSILPLWEDQGDLSILKELSVARATGGTVFHVTPDQWDTIMELVGGWPGSAPEIASAESVIAEYAGKRRSGQGYAINADLRRAIEQYSMQQAKAFYEEQGWSVSDVSATHSYDLLCTSATGKELHVEVKGTTSDGAQILLTANELKHAQNFYPNVALFILARIQVDLAAPGKLKGGEIQIREPWDIREGMLSPIAFTYNLRG